LIDLEEVEDEIEEVQKEISVLSQCDNERVIKYYGSYLNDAKLWIITEFCGGGSLLDILKFGVLNEASIAVIMRELLIGLSYLHNEGKIHRDLKAANVLLSANGDVKLADLGVTGQLTASTVKRHTFVGTPFWMAPEVCKQKGYDVKADIWSVGITAIELAKGLPPHAEKNPMEVIFTISNSDPPELGRNYSKNFKSFVKNCLMKNPIERSSAKELLKHPFIRKAKKVSILTELLERKNVLKKKETDDSDSSDSDLELSVSPTNKLKNKTEADNGWIFETIKVKNKKNDKKNHDIIEWLKSIGLEKYSNKFIEEHIEFKALLDMEMSDVTNLMKKLDIRLGAISKINLSLAASKKNTFKINKN